MTDAWSKNINDDISFFIYQVYFSHIGLRKSRQNICFTLEQHHILQIYQDFDISFCIDHIAQDCLECNK